MNEQFIEKENLEIPEEANAIDLKIIEELKDLIAKESESPTSKIFLKSYMRVLDLLELFQEEVISYSKYDSQCKAGCSLCCNHWVEDVNSFELRIICKYIEDNFSSDEIDKIVVQCEQDENVLSILSDITDKQMEETDPSELGNIERTDLLLASFYQMNRPCPLLNSEGKCSVYRVRPITCRIYYNFSSPIRCDPKYINEPDIPTYLVDLKEEANSLLDILHYKFNTYSTTGLRSGIKEYFSKKTNLR